MRMQTSGPVGSGYASIEYRARIELEAGRPRRSRERLVAGSPRVSPQPVQDMATKPMPIRKARVEEVVGRIAGHAQPLHHGSRPPVVGHGEGHDLLESQVLEAE